MPKVFDVMNKYTSPLFTCGSTLMPIKILGASRSWGKNDNPMVRDEAATRHEGTILQLHLVNSINYTVFEPSAYS
jgi:hypothetical protein